MLHLLYIRGWIFLSFHLNKLSVDAVAVSEIGQLPSWGSDFEGRSIVLLQVGGLKYTTSNVTSNVSLNLVLSVMLLHNVLFFSIRL